MIRPATVWIALRYLRAQRTSQFSSLVALASVIGVALGVAALIVVLSVMNGFEHELRSRLVAITGHAAVITGRDEPRWREILADVEAYPGVESATPYIEVEAMVAVGGELAGAMIQGVDPVRQARIPGLDGALREGSLAELTPGSWRALLGSSLAARLDVGTGDVVRVMVPARDARGRVTSRLRELTVAGIFAVGVRDNDAVRVLVSLADAGVLAGLDDRVSGIRLQATDVMSAPRTLAQWLGHWQNQIIVVDCITPIAL